MRKLVLTAALGLGLTTACNNQRPPMEDMNPTTCHQQVVDNGRKRFTALGGEKAVLKTRKNLVAEITRTVRNENGVLARVVLSKPKYPAKKVGKFRELRRLVGILVGREAAPLRIMRGKNWDTDAVYKGKFTAKLGPELRAEFNVGGSFAAKDDNVIFWHSESPRPVGENGLRLEIVSTNWEGQCLRVVPGVTGQQLLPIAAGLDEDN